MILTGQHGIQISSSHIWFPCSSSLGFHIHQFIDISFGVCLAFDFFLLLLPVKSGEQHISLLIRYESPTRHIPFIPMSVMTSLRMAGNASYMLEHTKKKKKKNRCCQNTNTTGTQLEVYFSFSFLKVKF